ncbi:Alpha/Beta hydrolase protein [Apodospora peruviana]|uniref:Alpha/Beta hydrolase protein n=1 Tax=Apodospora peruviana TaxID=516989 RepID=A0AAE0HZS2_9PEZI|nr:Alpha/Beta hydrolase protein [Apodospora peruviana]
MSKIPTANGIPIPAIAAGSAPENLDDVKKPEKAKDVAPSAPSRFSLKMTAGFWRSLQCIGMGLHYLASPRPPNPAFTKSIPSTISKSKGKFTLHFYTPKKYQDGKKAGKKYPAIVNFHGGGFTLGNATDDARFARFVLETCDALFISVDYRLAPDWPFPIAVDDGADALLYLINHAAEYNIDPTKLATSGFSAGGNIAITCPMRLTAHIKTLSMPLPEHRIRAIATWYPITDYTLSRAERRLTAIRPDQTLPPALTTLFDASYLYPADLDLSDPFLSPSKASDAQLAESIPQDVVFYTCEWDMLLREGEELAKRLGAPPISKNVRYKMIPGVPHGWDKSPDPLKPAANSEVLYKECCETLRDIFKA